VPHGVSPKSEAGYDCCVIPHCDGAELVVQAPVGIPYPPRADAGYSATSSQQFGISSGVQDRYSVVGAEEGWRVLQAGVGQDSCAELFRPPKLVNSGLVAMAENITREGSDCLAQSIAPLALFGQELRIVKDGRRVDTRLEEQAEGGRRALRGGSQRVQRGDRVRGRGERSSRGPGLEKGEPSIAHCHEGAWQPEAVSRGGRRWDGRAAPSLLPHSHRHRGQRARSRIRAQWARTRVMTVGSVMTATVRIRAAHRGQARGSTSKMRRSNSAHRQRAARRNQFTGSLIATGSSTNPSAPAPSAAWRRRLGSAPVGAYLSSPRRRSVRARLHLGIVGAGAPGSGHASYVARPDSPECRRARAVPPPPRGGCAEPTLWELERVAKAAQTPYLRRRGKPRTLTQSARPESLGYCFAESSNRRR